LKNNFPKEERVTGLKIIRQLVATKNKLFEYPFRIKWVSPEQGSTVPLQVLIGVPKYNFKRATDRNLLKRRIREAYRLNKFQFVDILLKHERHMAVSITYSAKEILPFNLLQQKIILILQRLTLENEKGTG
jgi:ribonuclease P protein component